jgi:hypothetical protein
MAAPLGLVRALFDYDAVEDIEVSFKEGDQIQLTEVEDPEWWKGIVNGVEVRAAPQPFCADANSRGFARVCARARAAARPSAAAARACRGARPALTRVATPGLFPQDLC